jgi:hypothetical protein
MVQTYSVLATIFWWEKVNSLLCLTFFFLFALLMPMLFRPQKLDIMLKRIECHLSSASTIRYRRAEVLAKVLLSIDIFFIPSLKERHQKHLSHRDSVIEVFYTNFEKYKATIKSCLAV